MKKLVVIAVVVFIASSVSNGEIPLYFCWYESQMEWSGFLDHFDIYASVNGAAFYFVESMAGVHGNGQSGSASYPYRLPILIDSGDVVMIKVRAINREGESGPMLGPLASFPFVPRPSRPYRPIHIQQE